MRSSECFPKFGQQSKRVQHTKKVGGGGGLCYYFDWANLITVFFFLVAIQNDIYGTEAYMVEKLSSMAMSK